MLSSTVHTVLRFFNKTAAVLSFPFNPCVSVCPVEKALQAMIAFITGYLGVKCNNVMELAFVPRSVVILFFPGTNLVCILDGKIFPQVKGFQMVSQMKSLLLFLSLPHPSHPSCLCSSSIP